ncbi:hypothetical protein EN993_35355, partial [Mesorhizobium sp. M7D.F.Ca.US.004.01.2.1]
MTAEIAPALIDPRLKPGADLLAEGRTMARDWCLGSCRFLTETGMPSEAAWKRKAAAEKRVMQHAHIGFRSVDRTVAAIGEVHEQCRKAGVTVDRFGITLDWSMG